MPDLLGVLRDNQALLREIALRYGVPTGAENSDTVLMTPESVAAFCTDMTGLLQEQLRVLLLTTKSELIEAVTVYQGTVNAASTRIAEILRPAVVAGAPYMIVVHNHPSGDPAPSPADLRINRKLLGGAESLEIDVYDHVIVGRRGFVSMAQRKLGGFA